MPRKLAEHLWQQREQRDELEEAVFSLEEAQPISPEEAIARHDRLVVLGEAGSGKSTLLRHLAWDAGDHALGGEGGVGAVGGVNH